MILVTVIMILVRTVTEVVSIIENIDDTNNNQMTICKSNSSIKLYRSIVRKSSETIVFSMNFITIWF